MERVKGSRWRSPSLSPAHYITRLGTRLKRSLGTSSLREAQRLRWPVVAELKAIITGKTTAGHIRGVRLRLGELP